MSEPSGLLGWFVTALVAGLGWTLGCAVMGWLVGLVKR
jgi:hypothetical protein